MSLLLALTGGTPVVVTPGVGAITCAGVAPAFAAFVPQILVPISTLASGLWVPSTGATLYGTIDETTASDTDYDSTTAPSIMEVGMTVAATPSASAVQPIIAYRIRADSGALIVTLKQGATTIASWTHSPAPASFTTYTPSLTSGQTATITDYAALSLQFEAA